MTSTAQPARSFVTAAITRAAAAALVAAARATAGELGVEVAVAVTDAGALKIQRWIMFCDQHETLE